jgi:malate dehydrogenase (oxaloacetate-decarboxylating)(NADP+)
MVADAALSEVVRDAQFPNSRFRGEANLLVMPSLDAANISYNLMKAAGGGLPLGPILLGVPYPVHVLVPSVSVRGLLNMTAVAAVNAATRASVMMMEGGDHGGE